MSWPAIGIRRRIPEHVDEDRRDQLGGLLLGFAAQADDAFGAGEEVDDAALVLKVRQGNLQRQHEIHIRARHPST